MFYFFVVPDARVLTKPSHFDLNVLNSLSNTSLKLSQRFCSISSLRVLILILNFDFLIYRVCVFSNEFLPQCCSSREVNPIGKSGNRSYWHRGFLIAGKINGAKQRNQAKLDMNKNL